MYWPNNVQTNELNHGWLLKYVHMINVHKCLSDMYAINTIKR